MRGNLLFSFMVLMTLAPAMRMYGNFQTWNFNYRVSVLDNFIFSIGVLFASIDVFLMSERFESVVNLTKSKFKLETIDLDSDFLQDKINLVKNITEDVSKNTLYLIYVMLFFFTSFSLIPLSGFIFYLLQLKSAENLSRPFSLHSYFNVPSFIPEFVENLVLTSIELFGIYYTMAVTTNIHALQSLSINILIGDMKLFQLNVEEVDECFEQILKSEKYEDAPALARKTMENKLRLATRNLVIHHIKIFRKVEQLNYGSNFRIFYVNCYMCLQIVFGISIFLKGELINKIKYGFMTITIVIVEYFFSQNGQLLQNEGEQLKMALYDSRWIGKPRWFIRALQILMLRSNKLPKVGLLNIFTLNRNNMTEVIRGAYSYFNLLNKFS
ncbi:uncharacterized protein LOC111049045 isoform X2 [Nilaparvata lugens]|uniref:uncharacterized protein LOC111049045 isoform X2 n=1 Tax=Nilaparvata lugens TaxID=108931 RepID=UPI00193DE233|nr:uncharacterized protein LOC111049045 isoform X2 [Nilaparvata lugens]